MFSHESTGFLRAMTNRPGLIYTGAGFLLGVPARDLSADEADAYGRDRLRASGIYQDIAPATQPDTAPAPATTTQPPAEETDQ